MARHFETGEEKSNGARKSGANGWWAAIALAAVTSAGWLLSGCAGLTTNSAANATPQAVVQITPADITFSNVKVGQQAVQSATLTNTGNSTVTVSQLAVSSSQFSTTGLATPLSLGPGQSAKFQIAFARTSTGSTSATLTAMTAHGEHSTKVRLSGSATGGASTLSVSSSSLSFGNVLVNGSSTQAVTLTNSGLTDVQVSQVAVSGTGFSISGLATPVTISAGQSSVLQTTFAPTAAGSVTGLITISSNAANATTTIKLDGTATAATYTMSLSPSSISFGNVNVGSNASKALQLSNTGNSAVTVSQIAATGAGISVSGLSLPLTLGPAQSATMNVSYSPTAPGAITGTVTVTNNESITAVVAVTGSGAQANLSLTPSTASFGSVVTGNTNSQTIQLKNTGTASLVVSQATVSGSGFSLSGLSLPLTLAAGQSGTFNVQYAPQAAGTANGMVSIVSNAPNSPASVSLSGAGIQASYTLNVSPGSLSFGNVTDGSSATQSFTLTNTGNASVAISGVTVTGAGYAIAGGSNAVTLSPNQSTAVSVQFAPTVAGSATGSVSVASNAATGSTVTLSGTGVAQSVQHSTALSWGASNSSVAGYNVYRSTVSGSAYVRINGSLVAGVGYSDSTVQSGQTYYYVATAVDGSGNESVYSNEVATVIP